MREFDLLVAVDLRTVQLLLRQDLIEEQARPGIRIAVDEAGVAIDGIRQ